MKKAFIALCHSNPVRGAGFASGLALTIQLVIDRWLGEVAEYFNTWHTLLTLSMWLADENPLDLHFLMGQEALGPFALPAALGIMISQPLINGWIIVAIVRLVTSRNEKED